MRTAVCVSVLALVVVLPAIVNSATLRDQLKDLLDAELRRLKPGSSNKNPAPAPAPGPAPGPEVNPDDSDEDADVDDNDDDNDDDDVDDVDDDSEDDDDDDDDADDDNDDDNVTSSCGGLSSADLAIFDKSINVSVEVEDGSITIESNGYPGHAYGPFPSADNPNTLGEQDYAFDVPECPTEDPSGPSCLPNGYIGVAINGIPIFNPFNINGEDALETEVMDSCNGHPDKLKIYHYHALPTCLYTVERDQLLGVALDGYPIYGPINADGVTLTSADLDDCHGEETDDGGYRYRITNDYPYILGCFKGTVGAEVESRQSRNCLFAKRDSISTRSTLSRHLEGRVVKYKSTETAKRQLAELLDILDKTDM